MSRTRAATAVAALAVGGALLGTANDYQLYLVILGAVYLIAVVGLNILVGYGGLISLGTAAFMLIGAYVSAVGVDRGWWSHPVGTLVAALACGLLGLVAGFPSLRLGPFALAVVTLAYGQVATALVLYADDLTGGGAGLLVDRADLAPGALLGIVGAMAGVVWLVHRNLMAGRWGRMLKAVGYRPVLAESLGIRPMALRLGAFVAASALAGMAGALYPAVDGYASTTVFTVELSSLLLLMVLLGGGGTTTGPLVGTAALVAMPVAIEQALTEGGTTTDLVYGLVLVACVLVFRRGIVGTLQVVARQRRARAAATAGRAEAMTHPEDSRGNTSPGGESSPPEVSKWTVASGGPARPAGLRVEHLAVAIGHLTILDGVSLDVAPGTVHGLIGPNGSGKTTLLNCVSGFVPARQGRMCLGGTELPASPADRARAGVARTFQQPLLLPHETVLHNVLIGFAGRRRSGGASLLAAALGTPGARRAARGEIDAARQLLASVGLAGSAVAGMPVSELSPGQQRLVEIARALALAPSVLLLDEPAAGLTDTEVEQLRRLVGQLRDAGLAVVLVEHHADLVLACCDTVTVLSSGTVLASGPPAAVRQDPMVIRTYLGAGYAAGSAHGAARLGAVPSDGRARPADAGRGTGGQERRP